MGTIVVGTSSWADPGFVAEWYPEGLPDRDRLPWYAERFDGVEVNATYYAVPGAATVRRWAEVTPKAFTFDVKLHQSLSRHSAEVGSLPRALRDDVDTTPRGRVRPNADLDRALCKAYKKAMRPLADAGKLSSYLLQLSPAFKPPSKRLEELDVIIEALAPTSRSPSSSATARGCTRSAATRRSAGCAIAAPCSSGSTRRRASRRRCCRRSTRSPTPRSPTCACTAATRAGGSGAGRSPSASATATTREELEELAQRAEALAEEADEVRVMFNNNRGDDAPAGAAQMKDLLT